jgi:hypothetical protein
MELDCNTIFDAGMHGYCPTCGSVEFYPLESWLNRDRSQTPQPAARATVTAEAGAFESTPRALWLGRLRAARAESQARAALLPARLRIRPGQRRRVG